MNLRKIVIAMTVSSVGLVAGCDFSSSSDEAADELGEDLGNALILGMAEAQYKKIKEKFDKGEDASMDCIIDTNDLRKDENEKAQQLAKDLDQICEYDLDAIAAKKELDSRFAEVEAARTEGSDMLPSRQFMLKGQCESIDDKVNRATENGFAESEAMKALVAAKTEICVPDNLEAKPTEKGKKGKKGRKGKRGKKGKRK